jgi:hydroxyacylglutathione hydrolase
VFFRQVLHDDLGCASYVVADDGEAAVIDPKWDVEDYLALAAEHGFAITHILETHNHADHVSGRGRLAAATGATIHVSVDAGVEFPHEPLRDGDEVEVGCARIRALAAPGHRPEHLVFAVMDGARSDDPWLLLSGDSLFVGDVARPDLAVDATAGAAELFHTLRRLAALDRSVELWPGHIGGSLCGGAGMSEKPSSTLGYELRSNALLRLDDEGAFVARLTAELAPQPPNFRRIVELNRGSLLTEAAPIAAVAPQAAHELLAAGATLVDGRAPRAWDAEHVPGSMSVTMVRAAVGTRAAWILDPSRPVLVTAASEPDAERMARRLEAVGFRDLRGFMAGGIEAWKAAGFPVESTPALDIPGLARELRAGRVRLLDVRDDDEWRAGHVEGSLHVAWHELRDGPSADMGAGGGATLAVACSAGNRSALAVSLLRRAGVENVVHVADGGIQELPGHGVELVGEEEGAP